MIKIDYRYKFLSMKNVNDIDKSIILSTYTNEELDNILCEIYNDIINETINKSKDDLDLMIELRVYSILKEERKKRNIKKLEIKFE